jgi:hypothetical protein
VRKSGCRLILTSGCPVTASYRLERVRSRKITFNARIRSPKGCQRFQAEIYLRNDKGGEASMTCIAEKAGGRGSGLISCSDIVFEPRKRDWAVTSIYVDCQE